MSVRLGFIGVGGIARSHLGRLATMEDVTLAAFADINQEAAEAAANQYGGKAFTEAEAMLDAVELDGVYIAIPPFAHGPAERAALQRNLPMFVEKPVHLDMGEAREFAAEVEKRGIITAAGYQERYIDAIAKMKEFLAGKPIGLIMGYWLGGTPRVAWWRRRAMSGGQAVEQTTHVFDMARYLFGEVRLVQAVAQTGMNPANLEGYDVEDASAVNLQFENGIIGTIFSGCCFSLRGGVLPAGIDVFCPDALVKYQRRKAVLVISNEGTEEWPNENDYQYDSDRAFIDAILRKDGTGILSTYPDAVRSLEVSVAANASMETGKAIELPL